MRWTFSDGTTVDLGGKVEGPTLLAQRLRNALANGPTVQIWAHPSEPVSLNPDDPALLEAWLRSELDFWTRIRELALTLKSPQGIPDLPPPPWDTEKHDPTVAY